MYIQFFPTFSCKASCSFCFTKGLSADKDIAFSEMYRLPVILAENGIKELDILGGEPTLYPHLGKLLNTSVRHGIRISLSSNGSDIELLDTLSRNFERHGLKIGISLNGLKPDNRLLSAIREQRYMVKSVCSRSSFLPEFAAELLGLSGVNYYAIYMDAMSRADLAGGLSFPDYYAGLKKMQTRYNNLQGVYCGGFLPDTENNPQLGRVRCPAGTTKLSVMPDGSVYPCYLLFSFPEYRLGNILTDDFGDLLRSPTLKWFSTYAGNQCASHQCELHKHCHGGCPAVSLMVSGDINAPDPRCIRT